MTNPEQPSTPSGSSETSTTKATDHELQEYDIFTRYGQAGTEIGVIPGRAKREPGIPGFPGPQSRA